MTEFAQEDARFRERIPAEADLHAFLERLMAIGPRLMGTEGERKAQRFLVDELEAPGLEVRFQPFEADSYRRGKTEVILHAGGGSMQLEGLALECSPSTEGPLRIELVGLGDGMDEDFERVRNRIPGRAVYAPQVWSKNYRRGARAGALAYLEPSSPKFDEIRLAYMRSDRAEFTTPRIRLSFSSGKAIEQALAGDGPPELTVDVTGETVRASTGNIEAVLEGATDLPPVLIGAHVDTFAHAPGAVDNGTGIASVLMIARAFAGLPRPKRTVRFHLFTGEEDDKVGSRRYVAERLPASPPAGVYFNFDVPLGGRLVLRVMAGEGDSHEYWKELGVRLGAPFIFERNMCRNSDHYPFYRAGVPCLMIRGKPEKEEEDMALLVHTRLDTLDRVDMGALHESVTISGRILRALANEEKLPFSSFTPKPDEARYFSDT